MSPNRVSEHKSENVGPYLVAVLALLLNVLAIPGAVLLQLPQLVLLAVILDVCLVWAWFQVKMDREERLQRQRASRGSGPRKYFLPRVPELQGAEESELHRREEQNLRIRIAELEDQLAQAQSSTQASAFSPVPEAIEEKKESEVVVTVEARGGIRGAGEERSKTKATSQQPVERGAHQPRPQPHRTEKDELTIRRKAIQVLLAALDDAVAKGILTQEDYEAKKSKYNRELSRIDKSLRTLSR